MGEGADTIAPIPTFPQMGEGTEKILNEGPSPIGEGLREGQKREGQKGNKEREKIILWTNKTFLNF